MGGQINVCTPVNYYYLLVGDDAECKCKHLHTAEAFSPTQSISILIGGDLNIFYGLPGKFCFLSFSPAFLVKTKPQNSTVGNTQNHNLGTQKYEHVEEKNRDQS